MGAYKRVAVGSTAMRIVVSSTAQEMPRKFEILCLVQIVGGGTLVDVFHRSVKSLYCKSSRCCVYKEKLFKLYTYQQQYIYTECERPDKLSLILRVRVDTCRDI